MKKTLILTVDIGALLGFTAAQAAPKGGPGPKQNKHFEEMSTRLNLTADQQAQLKPVMDGARQEMEAIRNDASLTPEQKKAKLKEARTGVDSKIEGVLTAEQKQQFAAMKAERKPHGAPGKQHGPGPGGKKGPKPGGADAPAQPGQE